MKRAFARTDKLRAIIKLFKFGKYPVCGFPFFLKTQYQTCSMQYKIHSLLQNLTITGCAEENAEFSVIERIGLISFCNPNYSYQVKKMGQTICFSVFKRYLLHFCTRSTPKLVLKESHTGVISDRITVQLL